MFCDSRTPPNAPALVARYGPFPNVWSQECSSGRTERSIPRRAPPHFKRFDGCQTVQSIKHLVACSNAAIASGRVPLQATAKIHVPARAQVYTASATKRKRPTEQSRPTLDVQQESDCDGIEIIGDHAQHLRRGDAQRLRNRAQQLGAGLFLATLTHWRSSCVRARVAKTGRSCCRRGLCLLCTISLHERGCCGQ